MSDVLPLGWERAKIGEITLPFDSIQPNQRPHDDFRYIDIGCIDNRLQKIAEAKICKGRDAPSRARRVIQKDDVLFSTVRTYLKNIASVPAEYDGDLTSTGICVLRPSEAVDPAYLFRWTTSDVFVDRMSRSMDGTMYPAITDNDLFTAEIALPPLNEQRRIVAKIEALMARSARAREALDAIPALLDRYRQSVLAAAFRGDLTADWRAQHPDVEPASDLLERVRQQRRRDWEWAKAEKARIRGKPASGASRLAGYPEPCEVTETAAIILPQSWSWATVDMLTTRVQYGSSAKANLASEGVPVLRMGNLVNGELDYADLRYLPNDHTEFPELLLEPGELLFNRTNSAELVGKTAVYDGAVRPCSFASYLIRLKPVGVLPEYLCGYINSPYGRAWVSNVVSQQVGQANVNGTKLKALALPVPPVVEQGVIVARLADVARMIRILRRRHNDSIQGLSTLSQSILAKAFRGELVPQDPNDEPASMLLARIRAERSANGSAPRGRRRKPASTPMV